MRRPTTRPERRALRALVAALLLGAAAAPMAALAQGGGQDGTLGVSEARERLSAANEQLAAAEGRLVALEEERSEIFDEHSMLTAEQQTLALDLERAKRDLRQLVVTSYMAGGPAGSAERLLDVDGFNESVWRAALIDSQTERTVETAERYDRLLAVADTEVRELVERMDQNRAKLEHASLDAFYASIATKDAEQQLQQARTRERLALARAQAPSTASAGGSDAWARLRQCESSGNYQAISSSGKYRGAYQFDQRTWESVGGVGDPAAASPEEQDLRARILYSRSGARPWPNCGRFLR